MAEAGVVRILMATPHLPPHQAANALLPRLLGDALGERGHEVRYLTWGQEPCTEAVVRVRRRSRRLRRTKLPQLLEAFETWRKVSPLLPAIDVTHIHSSTWTNQVVARLCERRGVPYVLTHYGTEIWHHDGADRLFRRMNRKASHVAFYSAALLRRARELEVPMAAGSVIYPPVPACFQVVGPEAREVLRRRHLDGPGPLLLNVKRLHPLADQKTLLLAMARVWEQVPTARLLIAGTGEAETALRELAGSLHLGESVRFLGLVPNHVVAELQAAADLFVLSSVLEATPTVALEALASGTPVVSTDNPGGLELSSFFGDDLVVVPRQDPEALARAILAFLAAPRRVSAAGQRELERRFRLDGVLALYLGLYREAQAR